MWLNAGLTRKVLTSQLTLIGPLAGSLPHMGTGHWGEGGGTRLAEITFDANTKTIIVGEEGNSQWHKVEVRIKIITLPSSPLEFQWSFRLREFSLWLTMFLMNAWLHMHVYPTLPPICHGEECITEYGISVIEAGKAYLIYIPLLRMINIQETRLLAGFLHKNKITSC